MIILLVAIVLLFVVTAFAALAIDLVTFYTARSEAQLAADSAALAAARVLANSGMTSDLPTDPNYDTLVSNAVSLATTVATQVATGNQVGGRNLSGAEVTVNFRVSDPNFGTNPQVTVQVQRADLPTFFARIWGRTQITVSASAAAEAYNASGHVNVSLGLAPPVAPSCVKPWLLPNIDPGGGAIFDPNGAILDWGLLGTTPNIPGLGLQVACPGLGTCNVGMPAFAWQYYPGSQTDFPAPLQSDASPACSAGFSAYQLSIAGCVQPPMVCGQNSNVNLDPGVSGSDADTAAAVNCLTHTQSGQSGQADSVVTVLPQPFQFLAGNDNPVVSAQGHDVLVSSSLVTVPVVESFGAPQVKVIGFIQVFLNPTGSAAANGAPAKVINMVGCGPNMSGQPILGNGASPVAVRLISQ